MKRNSDASGRSDRNPGAVHAAVSGRKAYQAPEVIHEADLEVRAGSPLLSPGDPGAGNPWDPDYGQQSVR